MKKEKKYLDYEAIKKAVSVLDVLTEHHNWGRHLETIAEGRTYTGTCPICETEHGNPFRVSIEEDGTSAWFCLADCNSGGNVLDFVAKKEDTDIHEAAFLLHEWFDLEGAGDERREENDEGRKGLSARHRKGAQEATR